MACCAAVVVRLMVVQEDGIVEKKIRVLGATAFALALMLLATPQLQATASPA